MLLVQYFKHGDRLHLEFDAHLLAQTPEYILTYLPKGGQVISHTRGMTFTQRWESFAFWYTTGRFYSIHIAVDEDGAFLGAYCNVNTPARLAGSALQVIDLDLDVRVEADFSFTVVDQDEFEQHRLELGYPPEWVQAALEAVDEICGLIKAREHPFDLSAREFRRHLAQGAAMK